MLKHHVKFDRRIADDPQAILERTIIAEFLLAKGHLMSDLADLPEEEANGLMKEASLYADLKLVEIEILVKA